MRLLLACLLSLVAWGAAAQENIYAGLGFGEFSYEEQFTDANFGKVSETVSAYKLFGGFEVNDYFAVEVSYGKDDSIVRSTTGFSPQFGEVFYQFDLEYTKTALRAVGQLPFESIALLGGLGYFSADGDLDELLVAECCGADALESSLSDSGMMALLGVEWRFGRFGARYALRLEYEWWDMSDVDASTVGLAFSYGF
jgi:hypothetical protein